MPRPSVSQPELAEPRRIEDIVALQAMKMPAHNALVHDGVLCSYGELQKSIEAASVWLAQSGARPRDRIMLVCENSLAGVALYFACNAIGASPVIVNARLSMREIDAIRQHCESRLMVFTVGDSTHAKRHAERYGLMAAPEIGCLGAIAASPPNKTAEPDEAQEGSPDSDIGAIIYTTGTTGQPKGVMLTHANLRFVARATAQVRGLSPDDNVYATAPISHTLGLTGVLLGSLLSGATVHLASRFDPDRVLGLIRNGRISVMIGTPSMYALLVQYAHRKGMAPLEVSRLRLISSAGAPLDAATKKDTEALFGQPLHNGYGISECGPSIALTSPSAPRADCSVGRLLPGIEAKLVGATEDGSSSGIGELLIRSPGLMKGYFRAPAETERVIDDEGWFHTGDLARFDGDHLFIVGRAKEMIIRFGFNVYPAEVEAVLNGHPQVFRSAVVGRSRDGTEDIVAFVQLATGARTGVAELAEHAASGLAAYKRPTKIVLVPELPIGENGKILKAALSNIDVAPNGLTAVLHGAMS
ncbi:MAG TPA: AMP-binding protein [Rhizomicrobium sp.]